MASDAFEPISFEQQMANDTFEPFFFGSQNGHHTLTHFAFSKDVFLHGQLSRRKAGTHVCTQHVLRVCSLFVMLFRNQTRHVDPIHAPATYV